MDRTRVIFKMKTTVLTTREYYIDKKSVPADLSNMSILLLCVVLLTQTCELILATTPVPLKGK
jgi:hypothetical protein